MGETGRASSLLVHILVIALCLTAFGFAIAAERRRSTVLHTDLLIFFYTSFFSSFPSSTLLRRSAHLTNSPGCAPLDPRGSDGSDADSLVDV
jgi:hypothetical protein